MGAREILKDLRRAWKDSGKAHKDLFWPPQKVEVQRPLEPSEVSPETIAGFVGRQVMIGTLRYRVYDSYVRELDQLVLRLERWPIA